MPGKLRVACGGGVSEPSDILDGNDFPKHDRSLALQKFSYPFRQAVTCVELARYRSHYSEVSHVSSCFKLQVSSEFSLHIRC